MVAGRPRINEEETPARLPAGTLKRIDAILRDGERRAEFIREAIERELKRREGLATRKVRP
jgi:metal-responsive CopG/Arc/MetJ family transcriptional regulator